MSRDSFTYTHGDTGTEPSSSLDFKQNERPEAQHFDWYWNKVIESIKGHANEFDRLDDDDDGVVDKADLASDSNALEGNSASYFVADGTDIIGTTRLDESITPTWTGSHTFEDTVSFSYSSANITVNDTSGSGTSGIHLNISGTLSGLLGYSTSADLVRLQERQSDDGDGYRQIRLQKNGNIALQNGDVAIDEGQSILDDGGTNRLDINSGSTLLCSDTGSLAFAANSGSYASRVYSKSGEPFQIRDVEDSSVTVEYTASTGGGTLNLTNASLSMGSNAITDLPAPSNANDAARKGYVDSETSTLQSSSDVDHDSTTGGTSGNPHANSASTDHGNGDENYTLQINGTTVTSGDTINFQT